MSSDVQSNRIDDLQYSNISISVLLIECTRVCKMREHKKSRVASVVEKSVWYAYTSMFFHSALSLFLSTIITWEERILYKMHTNVNVE